MLSWSLNFYHRLILHADRRQTSLYHIATRELKCNDSLSWTDAVSEAFHDCLKALADTAHLAHPLHEAPMRLSTDASNIAVRAVLEQFAGYDWQTLGFFSRKLTGV